MNYRQSPHSTAVIVHAMLMVKCSTMMITMTMMVTPRFTFALLKFSPAIMYGIFSHALKPKSCHSRKHYLLLLSYLLRLWAQTALISDSTFHWCTYLLLSLWWHYTHRIMHVSTEHATTSRNRSVQTVAKLTVEKAFHVPDICNTATQTTWTNFSEYTLNLSASEVCQRYLNTVQPACCCHITVDTCCIKNYFGISPANSQYGGWNMFNYTSHFFFFG